MTLDAELIYTQEMLFIKKKWMFELKINLYFKIQKIGSSFKNTYLSLCLSVYFYRFCLGSRWHLYSSTGTLKYFFCKFFMLIPFILVVAQTL